MSHGKLCKEHGCIYEWPSGREPRLTPKWVSDPLQQRELRPIASNRTIIKFYHSFILDIAFAGSVCFFGSSKCEGATGNCSEDVAGNCNGDGIPVWPEDFTENLEIVETAAPAEISHDLDPERPLKVASRKHSIFTHFPKDQKLRGLQANQDYEGSLQKEKWKFSIFGAEKFGDLITADHKVLNKGAES